MSEKYWIIRNYQPTDFDDYARLQMETTQLDHIGQNLSRQILAEQLAHPSFHPQKDLFLAVCEQNLIGYARVFLEPGIGRTLLEGLVHPRHRRKGVATDLFGCAIAYARAARMKAAQVCIPQTNTAAKKLLISLRLAFLRYFFGYKLDLNTTQLPAVRPGKFIFRHLQPGEAEVLTAIQNRSFADSWGFNPNTLEEITYRINSISCLPENIIMVYFGSRPVAYCWTKLYHRSHPVSGAKVGEIHMLGVDPDFRNQSLGRNVLTAGLAYLRHKGAETVELMADGEMPAALALYESAGFQKYQILEWYEKKLTGAI